MIAFVAPNVVHGRGPSTHVMRSSDRPAATGRKCSDVGRG
jgi:hypothetical protein